MFSDISKKHADACRFCWMCRHLCPIQQATGKETNTPRAKGLQVSMMERGMPMDLDVARTMYECLLCGACTNDCATGFDPLIYIREARTHANVNDLVPPEVQRVIDRATDSGNIYGATQTSISFEGIPDQGDMLVWLGETARYAVPQTAEAFMSILKKAGIPFAALKDEPSSGCSLGDLIGLVEDVRARARQAAAAIAAAGAKKMIVLDSYDAAMFLHEYQDWRIELPEIVTATAFLDQEIKSGHIVPQKKDMIVTYHDGSRLARDLDEHLPARDILAAMGCQIQEMWQNRRLATCCGSAVMGQYMPALHTKVAQGRWEHALRTEARVIVAACPQSTEALGAAVPEGCEYRDLFMMLNERI